MNGTNTEMTKKLAKSWQNDANSKNLAIHTVKKPHCLPTPQKYIHVKQ